MSLSVQRFILLAVLFSSSSAALAESYKDDDKVSSMKGQLVEVGDRNKYHYDFPRTNISVNPFGIVTGTYSVSGSYALTNNVAVRGNFSYAEEDDIKNSGYEVGAGAQIFFKKMYSGFYLEPGLVRMHQDIKSLDSDSKDWRYDAFGPQILVGYSWFWDSGFNVQLAAGAGRNWMKSRDQDKTDSTTAAVNDDNSAGKVFGNSYLTVGYAF